MSEITMSQTDTNTPPPPPPPAAFPVPQLGSPQAQPGYASPVHQRWNPGAAGVLSLLPGGGHLYLGLYQRGVTFFLIWVALMTIASEMGGPIGVAIPFWWLFVLIDAVRQAKHLNATGAAESNLVANDLPIKGGSLFLGVLMILIGLFYTLKRWVNIDLTFLRENAPLLLVLFGCWQVFSYFKEKKDAERKAAGESSPDATPPM